MREKTWAKPEYSAAFNDVSLVGLWPLPRKLLPEAIGLSGAGTVSLVSAGIFASIALHEQSNAQSLRDKTKIGSLTQGQLDEYNNAVSERDRFSHFALLGIAGAGILGIAGAITYVYDSQRVVDDPTTNQNKVAISLTIVPSSVGLSVVGAF